MRQTLNVCQYIPVRLCDEYGVNARFSLLFKEVCALKARGGGGAGSFLKKIVDQADGPNSGQPSYQNDLLKNLGTYNSNRIEIVVDAIEMQNWGAVKTFDYDPSSGTITLLDGYVWQSGSSLKVDLNQ